ncbi:MAG: MgtC/SapB family protein [Phycisphaerae bacterium]
MLTNHDIIGLLLAVLCGAIIGLEREFSGKAAGLRTNTLICLGAAVFTIVSKYMGAPSLDSQTRIAAGIVTGVGFLGAGAILHDRAGVLGLTTAATIWLVSSIGLACGAGMYELALVATGISLIVLFGLRRVEGFINKLRKNKKSQSEQRAAD